MGEIIELTERFEIHKKMSPPESGLFKHLRMNFGHPKDQAPMEYKWVRSILERYSKIVGRNCPELEEHEWFSLLAALCYTEINISHSVGSNWEYLANDAETDMNLEFPVDTKELAFRIQRMSHEKQCAIVEVATLFWTTRKDGDDLRNLLRQVGAKIKE